MHFSFQKSRLTVVVVAFIATANLQTALADSPVQPTLAVPAQPTLPITPIAGKLSATPKGLEDVIAFLAVNEPYENLTTDLGREIVRQALWLAATEEFGLRVRDGSLGETVPATLPTDRVMKLYRADAKTRMSWGVAVGPPTAGDWVWYGFPKAAMAAAHPIVITIVNAEADSRGLFADCLKAARFEPKANKRSEAGVPDAASKRLAEMREIDQFMAVRLLHAEMRAKGESDDLVAALSRGYANLSLLTEYQWSPVPAVFQARAILYAQRLVARSPKSATALWTRAYALALTGLHKMALADLEMATKLAADSKEAPPPWLETVDAFLKFDLKRLAEVRKNSDTPLARLLEYIATEEPRTPVTTIPLAHAYLKVNPECYRVFDGLCRCGGVSNLHSATVAWVTVCRRALPARIADLTGIPKTVVAELEKGDAQTFAALVEAGNPQSDAGVPSWSALATVTGNVRFLAAWTRLYFMAHMWGVDARDEAKAAAEALDGHPLKSLLESYQIDHRLDPAAVLKKLPDPATPSLDMRATMLVDRYMAVSKKSSDQFWGHAWRRTGSSYQDQARAVRRILGQPFDWNSSPHAPLGAAVQATVVTGDKTVATLAELENKFSGFAIVQDAIAERHEKDGRVGDAIRCWNQRIKLSPDPVAFYRVADLQLKNGNEAGWLKMMEASLEIQNTGLWHAQTQEKIARFYIRKKDIKKAEPYAEAAAESGAGWAYETLIECKLALEKWDEANAILKTSAERYDGQTIFQWYFACRQYEKLDRTAATKAVNNYMAQFAGKSPLQLQWFVGRFELLEGRPKEAIKAFSQSDRVARPAQSCMIIAIIADEIGDKATRDRELEALTKLPPDPMRNYEFFRTKIAGPMRDWIAKEKTPDAAAIAEILKDLTASDRVDASFFLGCFLANRGAKDRAIELWSEVVKNNEGSSWLKSHAKVSLDRAMIKPKPE